MLRCCFLGSGPHLALHMDVTQDTSVDEAIMDTRGHLGEPPSLLVNCAAIIRSAPCHLMDEKTFDSVIDVNLKVCGTLFFLLLKAKRPFTCTLRTACQ